MTQLFFSAYDIETANSRPPLVVFGAGGLGREVLLHLGCTVAHDANPADFCSLMPHANVGGAAQLAPGVYLGTNATVIQGGRAGANTIVRASAVAVRDLPPNITAVDVPAKE